MTPGGAHHATVLVVEDDADLAALAAEVLTLEGYAVATASNGREALTLLAGGLAPAVIVCDLMMPVLDGFGFLAEHGHRPPPLAPVVAVSAFEGYLARAAAAGAAVTLAKPYPVPALVEAVSALAGGRPPPAAGATAAAGRTPREERARLDAIHLLAADQPPPTGALDAFAARIAAVFDAPVALVSIVTADRQYWHAACGLPEDLARSRGSPRNVSFCTHAVAAGAALVVQDAPGNPFFADNPFVRQRGFRFYAGVPLIARSGEALGTLCLLDHRPHVFGPIELELLGALARRVLGELEARDRARSSSAPAAAYRHLDAWDPELDVLGRGVLEEVARLEALRSAARGWPVAIGVIDGLARALEDAVTRIAEALPAAHLGRLDRERVGVVAPRRKAEDLRALFAVACPGTVTTAIEADRPLGGAALLGLAERVLH